MGPTPQPQTKGPLMNRYPYLLYCRAHHPRPVIEELRGDPLVVDLSFRNAALLDVDVRDQAAFQRRLETQMNASGHAWGLSGYLERRDSLLRDCPQMVSENRFFHLGLDIIAPCNTPLCAPLAATVADSGYESGEGNYGGYVLLEHAGAGVDTFYSFYGHLSRKNLPQPGRRLSPGECFTRLGDFPENGNWFHHTHLQVITAEGLKMGYQFKGYCAPDDLIGINDLCPSPLPLFRA